jgi:hypothetical protein
MTKSLAQVNLLSPDGQTIRLGEVLSDKTVFVLVRYFG